jgi:hypothetical protein
MTMSGWTFALISVAPFIVVVALVTVFGVGWWTWVLFGASALLGIAVGSYRRRL